MPLHYAGSECLYCTTLAHLHESVRGEVSLEHAPGAVQELVGEDQEALAGPVQAVHDVLHDGLPGGEVSLVMADMMDGVE